METSMIVTKSYLSSHYFYYVEDLPSKDKWLVEYTTDNNEIELLKKPVAIEKIGSLDYDDIDWYDDSGNKPSNADHQYNIDDYNFYKITYECVCLSDELNYEIEPYEETMYVYTDIYIECSAFDIEGTINRIAEKVKDSYDIEDDHYYGDCYSDIVHDIKISIEVDSREGNLKANEYRDYLEEIRECFDNDAQCYLDNLSE